MSKVKLAAKITLITIGIGGIGGFFVAMSTVDDINSNFSGPLLLIGFGCASIVAGAKVSP